MLGPKNALTSSDASENWKQKLPYGLQHVQILDMYFTLSIAFPSFYEREKILANAQEQTHPDLKELQLFVSDISSETMARTVLLFYVIGKPVAIVQIYFCDR